MLRVTKIALLLWFSCVGAPAAHEFWIEPEIYAGKSDQSISIDLRVGQMLEGRSYPYLSSKIERFEVQNRSANQKMLGREGDIPAIPDVNLPPGLNVVSYIAAPESTIHAQLADFQDYAFEEGYPALAKRHLARELPSTNIGEVYRRNAKSLVQVGEPRGEDSDTPLGLPFEIVALNNPYDARGEKLAVLVLRTGVSVPDIQISVFERRASGEVSRKTVRTDEFGRASLGLTDGSMYLLSAVTLEEISDQPGIYWESIWASLTFSRPEGNLE